MAVTPQQHVEALVAEAGPELRDLLEPFAKRRIAERALRPVVPARPGEANESHRPATTHWIGGSQISDDSPPLFGRHHFRPATALSIAMSSAW